MPAPPLRLLLTIWLLAALALAALALGAILAPVRYDLHTLVLAGLLFGLILLARLYPVQLAEKTKTTVDTALLFAAALLLPAPLAIGIAAAAPMVSNLSRRKVWFQALFNSAEVALRVAIGAAVFTLVAGTSQLTGLEVGAWMVGAPAAAAAMFLVNGALVGLILGIQLHRSPFYNFWRLRQVDLPHEGALFLLGLLVAGLGVHYPWAIALLAVPSAVAHRSLREGVALRIQTRVALEQLADIVDMRDHYTYEHSRRVGELTRATAETLRLSADEVETIAIAARLHDVGKIGIKSTILMKPGLLEDGELSEMRRHPEIGARLLGEFPQFRRGCELVLSHHEKFDGSGYPRGLAGEAIPLGARIIAVADAWDAMTSNRAYRGALDLDEVYAEMERVRGTQFDPRVLDAFLQTLAKRPELAVRHVHTHQDVDVVLPRPSAA